MEGGQGIMGRGQSVMGRGQDIMGRGQSVMGRGQGKICSISKKHNGQILEHNRLQQPSSQLLNL